MSVETMRSRVRKGATFLDEKAPDWYTRINKKNLWMWSPQQCVVGQTFPDLFYSDSIYPWSEELGMEPAEFSYRYGFHTESPNESWNDLSDQWIEEIDVRLGKSGQ